MKLTSIIHKTYRAAYKLNRASRTAEVVASGKPARVERLVGRRAAYGVFGRLVNKLFR